MARAGPFATAPAPLAQAPPFARDAHELRAVLTTQSAEAEALKARMAESHRECARLRQRLRDAEGELEVAAAATTSATERLGSHAARHGLVLAAGVERTAAERATVEHELQRVEALLHEHDVEIRKLRKQAHDLEVAQQQYAMEIKGLEVSHEATNTRANVASSEVSALLQSLSPPSAPPTATALPSQLEVQRTEQTAAVLSAKQQEHQQLRQRAEATALEAKRLEGEELLLAERVRAFEKSLRLKQDQMQSHDERFLQETAMLQEQLESLRRTLHDEQRDAVTVDQRAVLHPQCGAEAEGVKREVAALMDTVPRLANTLRARGLCVISPEAADDPIDQLLHAYLNTTEAVPGQGPSVIWRLSPGEYLLGSTRVGLFEAAQRGRLVVRDDRGASAQLADVLQRRPLPVGAARVLGSGPMQTVNV